MQARQVIQEAQDGETIIQVLAEVQQARQPKGIDQSGGKIESSDSVTELTGGV